MNDYMRAAVIAGPRAVSIVDAPPPEPGAGQVRIRLDGTGLCGSNLPVWEGRPWFAYPLPPGAPGHEGWGTVERLGSGVEGLVVGARVAVLSERAFAELDVADATHVVPLPHSVGTQPFPGEALACAVNVLRRSGIRAGDRVAIVGVGFLGAVLVRLASAAGAVVTAISRRRFALDVAAALGARHQVRLGATDETVREAMAVSRGRESDVVIEATGLQGPLDVAAQLTATRGRLVIAGYHQDGPRRVDLQRWNWRGLDVINAHERDPLVYVDGMREAVRLVEAGRLPIDTLVTHVFPMAAVADAFRCAAGRPDGFLKAVVVTDAM